MNDKIAELVELSEVWHRYDDCDACEVDVETFVKLIVKECIKSVEEMYSKPLDSPHIDEWWKGYDARGADSIEIIKTHFGII